MMELFLHQVFSRGIQEVLGLSLVGLVCMRRRSCLLERFMLLVIIHQYSRRKEKICYATVTKLNLKWRFIKRNKTQHEFNTYTKEFSCILIAVINSYRSAANSNIKTNLEVSWLEWHIWSVLLNDYLSLQECTLWCSWVYLFWFCNQDWSVFKEIVDDQFSNSIVFKSWLYNWFFEISEKAKNLLN